MPKIRAKSRSGCKECKIRRVKCDESRPSCIRCSKARRPCAYDVLPPSSSNTRKRNPDSRGPADPSFLVPVPVFKGVAISAPDLADAAALNPRYSFLHLRLLYHFEHKLAAYMESAHPGMDLLIKLFITEAQALPVPYLMDEVLAYAAAHKSTLDEKARKFYQFEASKLQTQALTTYNSANPTVSKETCLPMFLFSSLIGHHILFDLSPAVPDNKDLGTILDGLTVSITIHRGMSYIARTSWPMFSESLQRQFLSTCVRERDMSFSRNECESLLKRLESSEFSSASVAVYREAVELLQTSFDSLASTPLTRGIFAAVQDWLIGISAEYLRCLNQRRPEALVVLAHFAVLLHEGAGNWFIGGLGKRIIQLVNDHLGPHWEDWLEWPNRMVGGM